MNTSENMTLADIKARYDAGLRPAELMSGLRDKAQQYQSHNIFIHLLTDDELSPFIQNLESMDRAATPLWGVPFVVKDNIDIAGIPTTAACEAFSYTPDKTATVVQKLIDQGALPLGKANLDQFATGLNGTRSPWGACGNSFDASLVSGGSSSGSAVAVALGLACFSLGTDTAGSGRIPACFNNLVGVKPSRGLLSASGVVPACRSLDCVSIFALHCDDANAVLAAAEGFDSTDAYSRHNRFDNREHAYGLQDGKLTLGVVAKENLEFFGDTHYAKAYQDAVDALEGAGVELVEIDYTPFDEVARLLYEGPWVSERYIATLPLIKEQPEALFPVVRDIVAGGEALLATDLFRAQYRLNELKQLCTNELKSVDALLTPTAGRLFSIAEMQADPVKHNSQLGYYMNFVNLLDMAAVAVPAGFTEHDLPFGLTLSAPALSDRWLLSIAKRLHALKPGTLGATGQPMPPLTPDTASRGDMVDVVVCGAHLEGLPLNHQLLERGAILAESTHTSSQYKLYALDGGSVKRPALVRVGEQEGSAIEVEVWQLPSSEVGSFLAGIPAPLGLGKVQLADDRFLTGFIAESCALDSAQDITHLGGWRAFVGEAS